MKKLTWKKLAREVIEHMPKFEGATELERIENTLRAFATRCNYENDPECDLLNAFHDLHPTGKVR